MLFFPFRVDCPRGRLPTPNSFFGGGQARLGKARKCSRGCAAADCSGPGSTRRQGEGSGGRLWWWWLAALEQGRLQREQQQLRSLSLSLSLSLPRAAGGKRRAGNLSGGAWGGSSVRGQGSLQGSRGEGERGKPSPQAAWCSRAAAQRVRSGTTFPQSSRSREWRGESAPIAPHHLLEPMLKTHSTVFPDTAFLPKKNHC